MAEIIGSELGSLSLEEQIVDVLTHNGVWPLLFSGLLDDQPEPRVVSARLVRGSRLLLSFLTCDVEEEYTAIRNFLVRRRVTWESKSALWRWAVSQKWPHANDLRDYLDDAAGSLNFTDEASSAVTSSSNFDRDAISRVVTQEGRFPFDCCFAFDQLIVAWDARTESFQFPLIDSFAMLQAAITLLETHGAALRLSGHWVDREPSRPQHSFADLERLGQIRGWPRRDAFLARTRLWETLRPRLD